MVRRIAVNSAGYLLLGSHLAGMIKRVRGIAFTTRASPSFGNRMVDDSKVLLQKYVGDVFVYKDHYKGAIWRAYFCFLNLIPRQRVRSLLGVWSDSRRRDDHWLHAERGDDGAKGHAARGTGWDVLQGALDWNLAWYDCALSSNVHSLILGGCVDTSNQGILVMLMALGPEDVAKLKIGKLSPNTYDTDRFLLFWFVGSNCSET